MKKIKATCNQCFKQMKFFDWYFVCKNPKCPNYALVQVPVEGMEKI